MEDKEKIMKNIAYVIRNYRKHLKLSQATLAEKIGIQQRQMTRIETGLSLPPIDRLIKFAKVFNCPITTFFMNQCEKEIKIFKTILVTGGAGYIGSHCVLALLKKNYNVIIFDNLSTGHIETIETLKKNGNVKFVQGDLLNENDIMRVFKTKKIDAVIHFAAFSQVAESAKNPQKYYINNVCGTLNLLKAMLEADVKKIVFSSTAATYGEPEYIPIDENHPQNPVNPYGQTKLMIERIMDDYDKAYDLKSARLRYFNVAGADSNGRVGEWHEPETHLIPNILKATGGKSFEMYGDDYDTKDGTCVRDYINVEDLAQAHILALDYLNSGGETDYFNIGTNDGNTVKEVFSICEKVTGKKIPVKLCPRREGDPASLVADNRKAKEILGWQLEKTLKKSIETAYSWQKNYYMEYV